MVRHFFYLIFRRVIFLHLEITLLFAELSYVFEENIFFRHHNFMKKVILSRPEVFCKKGVLRNFTKFTGEYQCQSLFFNKVAGLRPVTLLKKRLWDRCFPVTFVKFLRTAFLTEHLWWLLLELEG